MVPTQSSLGQPSQNLTRFCVLLIPSGTKSLFVDSKSASFSNVWNSGHNVSTHGLQSKNSPHIRSCCSPWQHCERMLPQTVVLCVTLGVFFFLSFPVHVVFQSALWVILNKSLVVLFEASHSSECFHASMTCVSQLIRTWWWQPLNTNQIKEGHGSGFVGFYKVSSVGSFLFVPAHFYLFVSLSPSLCLYLSVSLTGAPRWLEGRSPPGPNLSSSTLLLLKADGSSTHGGCTSFWTRSLCEVWFLSSVKSLLGFTFCQVLLFSSWRAASPWTGAGPLCCSCSHWVVLTEPHLPFLDSAIVPLCSFPGGSRLLRTDLMTWQHNISL